MSSNALSVLIVVCQPWSYVAHMYKVIPVSMINSLVCSLDLRQSYHLKEDSLHIYCAG